MKLNRLFYVLLILYAALSIQPVEAKRFHSPVPAHLRNVPPQFSEKKPVPPASFLLKPDERTQIILDPGHGGRDLGTHSKKPTKYQEKILTLATARMVKSQLEEMGYRVLMTRTRDVFISLDKRSQFANARDPDLFVSLHFNSAPNKQAEGIEIFYYRSEDDKDRTSDSKFLAHTILNRILKNTEAKSRGIKHGNLSVIRETNMPAVLVEGGFLTNESEAHKIKDPEYLKRLSQGIAQGIHDYLIRRK